MKTVDNKSDQKMPPGEGYLMAIGWLQIGAGALTLLGSLLAIGQSIASQTFPWFYSRIGEVNGVFTDLIANYISFLALFGWILGTMMIIAGKLSIKKKGERFIRISSLLNLINFPHGTTVAILALHGLSQQRIRNAIH